MTDDRRDPSPTPSAPTWLVWTNRAVLTVAGVVGAVLVNGYARISGEALDLALAVAIAAAAVVAVMHPLRPVPVMLASLLAMLGLALAPPLWLLALVPPLLVWTPGHRARRDQPTDPVETDPSAPDHAPPDHRDAP